MKRNIVNIFTPIGGTWKSYTLKHWHGKRVKYRGKYVKIGAAILDHDMNFVCWEIYFNGNFIELNDPNYVPVCWEIYFNRNFIELNDPNYVP